MFFSQLSMGKMNKIGSQDTPLETFVQVDSSDQNCSILFPRGALKVIEPDTDTLLPMALRLGQRDKWAGGSPEK